MSEISMRELEAQHGELLPERETLATFAFGSFDNHVVAVNSAAAYQAFTYQSSNGAEAVQNVITG